MTTDTYKASSLIAASEFVFLSFYQLSFMESSHAHILQSFIHDGVKAKIFWKSKITSIETTAMENQHKHDYISKKTESSFSRNWSF